MDKRRILISVAVVVLVGGGGTSLYLLNERGLLPEEISAPLEGAQSGLPGALEVTGFIEAEQIEIAVPTGGRVVALPFDEGDAVAAGDVLLQLDTSLLDAQQDIAEAQVRVVVAQRDLMKASPREEVIRQAQAQVSIAQAAVEAAKLVLSDAASLANNPQEIELQVIDAQTQLAVANEQLIAAQLQFTSAQRALDFYNDARSQWETARQNAAAAGVPGPPELPFDMTLAPQHYEEAGISLAAAQGAVEGAQNLLSALQSFADRPAALRAQVASAQSQVQTSEAAMEHAQAELEALKGGPDAHDLAVAEAQIEQAQAAIDAIQIRIDQMTITAPIGGLVMESGIHIGELAAPGIPLITLANLETVELTVYVPEDKLDLVSLNQVVDVTVDSFPSTTFEGTVAQIAQEAEFTPRGVQTREERVNLVFAVKIRIGNPELALKPGMPADVEFR